MKHLLEMAQLFKPHGLRWLIPSLMIILRGRPYNKEPICFFPQEILKFPYDEKVINPLFVRSILSIPSSPS